MHPGGRVNGPGSMVDCKGVNGEPYATGARTGENASVRAAPIRLSGLSDARRAPEGGQVTMAAYKPRPGDTVEDTSTKKIGKVMGFEGPYVQVRPVGGGLEWDAKPENLQPVTGADALSSAVAVANARSRGEQL